MAATADGDLELIGLGEFDCCYDIVVISYTCNYLGVTRWLQFIPEPSKCHFVEIGIGGRKTSPLKLNLLLSVEASSLAPLAALAVSELVLNPEVSMIDPAAAIPFDRNKRLDIAPTFPELVSRRLGWIT